MAIKQTAGRDNLGDLAPVFAHLNDDVLFGEVWSREDSLSLHDRSMITCAALMAQGLFPQLESHMNLAKKNGVTRDEMVELVTHLSFYAGWPKAWSAFGLVRKVYGEDATESAPLHGPFPLGDPADGPNFTGHAWLQMLGNLPAGGAGNVTFERGCYNRWHTHPKGQILLVTAGHGWEQQEGRPARELHAGDVVVCPPDVRHWHGAATDSTMTHIAITPLGDDGSAVDWLEFPDADAYAKLNENN
ncbi:MAG: carboxymuconolactone decarboxylase family protein [Bifidobacteriaceae bacterium]|nr:carboxymuconolactone decarboxylase family protein [Bifidobacteriaceae bacterium]